jgi:peptidoglycan/xylan/chitin deacetylase (PgdA/CDA1 family)
VNLAHGKLELRATLLRCFFGATKQVNMRRVVGGWLGAIVSVLLFLSPPIEAAEPPPLSVPILLFHRLGPVLTDDMTVTTPVVESELKLIQERGYHVIPLKTLLAAYNDPAGTVPERSVVLVADDGHKSVYTDLFPLIKKYQIPVTLFIYPSAISNPSAPYAMTWQQLAEMKASGLVDIQSHTFWHPNFKIDKKRLTPAAYEKFVQDQLVKSKAVLEQKLDIKVDLLAWPFGIYDPELMAAAKAAGYVAAFSIDRRPVTRAENVMSLPRSIVTDADRGARFEALLAPPKTTPTPSTPVKATTSK